MFSRKNTSPINNKPMYHPIPPKKPLRKNNILMYSALVELVIGFMGLPNAVLLFIMFCDDSQAVMDQIVKAGGVEGSIRNLGISIAVTLLLYVVMTAAGFLGTFNNGKKGKENLPYYAGIVLIVTMIIYVGVNILVLKNLFNLTAIFWCIIHLCYCHGAMRNRQAMLLTDR